LTNKTGFFFLICILWVYLVILAGGTVRATGAGLGCPDWPLCFGQLIPPMSVEDLPANWTDYVSNKSDNDVEFNPIHTWTEYINRLLGATLGVLSILLVFSARFYIKKKPPIFFFALGSLVSIAFNGWLGSLVVSSELRPVMVSLHMIGAFAVQFFLIFGYIFHQRYENTTDSTTSTIRGMKLLLALCFFTLLIQIGLGIQIRESVDWIIKNSDVVDRSGLIDLVPWIFYIHRSFSWVIFILSVVMPYKIFHEITRSDSFGYKNANFIAKFKLVLTNSCVFRYYLLFFALVCSQMFIGGTLNHLNFPVFAQPIHLLIANLMFGLLCYLWANSYKNTQTLTSGNLQQQILI
jgi:cytochrome c oxidase assembly protein subunit 15